MRTNFVNSLHDLSDDWFPYATVICTAAGAVHVWAPTSQIMLIVCPADMEANVVNVKV
jgi:hypothetical protein